MIDSPQARFRLLYSVRIVLALLGLFVLVDMGIGLSIWLQYHREQQIVQKIESCRGGSTTNLERALAEALQDSGANETE